MFRRMEGCIVGKAVRYQEKNTRDIKPHLTAIIVVIHFIRQTFNYVLDPLLSP